MFIADLIQIFAIYKTMQALITSPIFYLNVILIIGVAILFDLMILVLEREIRTPLYLLFKSLNEKKVENKE